MIYFYLEVRWDDIPRKHFFMPTEVTAMKKIVISGSISLLEKMKTVSSQLTDMGYLVILPEEVDWGTISEDKYGEYKKALSMGYFNEIAQADTYAVLAVNDTKRGIENYIGASAFAEIAIAVYSGKKVFVLNDLYEPYKDELSAWGVIPLHGKLCRIN